MEGVGRGRDVHPSPDLTGDASDPVGPEAGAAAEAWADEVPADRTGLAPRPVPEVDGFAFWAVQQGGFGRQLPWGSAELRLVFEARGVELIGQRRGEHSFIPWASVTRVSRGPSQVLPGGGSVTLIGIESPGRIMRFAVTSSHWDPIELTALSERVARWTTPESPVAGPPLGVAPLGGPPVQAATARVPAAPALLPYPSAGRPTPPVLPWPSGPYLPPPPRGRRRSRRIATLVVGLIFVAAGIGLAAALRGSGGPQATTPSTSSPPTPDQVLADQLMLTQSDLPGGWSVSPDGAGPGAGNSPRIQTGESKITRAFAGCMGISDAQASLILGGAASDQTAQTSSPVFLGPPSPGPPGFALELQTAATVVQSHQDEQQDFAALADPRYPQCAGAALASETQLGADNSSGRNDKPGASSVSVLDLRAPPGEQVLGLLVAFTVSDRSASVPIEVELVSLGHDRIEAQLQGLAIGGQIPSGALTSPLSVFADRVAGGGQSAEA